jgi:hypothetical protein
MTEAIFGLVGVIIGGMLNGGITWLVDRHRSKGAVKVAARLVLSELEMIEVSATSALQSANCSQLTFGDNAEWIEHRATLAAELPDDEWSALDNCFTFFAHLKAMAETGTEWDDENKKAMESLVAKTKWCVKALRSYAGEEVRIMVGLSE